MNERDANGEPADRYGGRVSRWLVHRAASAAPPALEARLEEEWLADLSARPSLFSRLRFALGCCWATMVIAHELRAAVPVTRTAAGPNFLGDASYFSRRSFTLLLVVALHVALFFALMNGLVRTVGVRVDFFGPLGRAPLASHPWAAPPSTKRGPPQAPRVD